MEKIRHQLQQLARGNNKYATGNKRIVNTQQTLIGVRMPDLRGLAKELARGMTRDEIATLFGLIDKNVYEEVMLVGMMITYAKLSDSERIELMRPYLELVDSWAQIDSVAGRGMNSQEWWDFACECLKSRQEFVVRFGIIVMMDNFLNDRLDAVFQVIGKVKSDKYYVRMGLAWLHAEAAIKDYAKTIPETKKLEPWTRRKALTKMLESYRFTPTQKSEIRELRDKIAS